jgi:hypothetical protein
VATETANNSKAEDYWARSVCIYIITDMEVSPSEKIKQKLLSWKGVTIHEHNFVTVMFYVGGIEMGHLHGDSIADLQFPPKVSKKLVKEGRVSPHHVIPKSGWVSYEIQNAEDVEAVVELFRLQYNRLAKPK